MAGYITAFKRQKDRQHKLALALLILCGLLLRVYTSFDFFLHCWDERYHALVAKNLLHHFFKPTLYENPVMPFDYTKWGGNNIWLHKQPLTLWLMAISLKIFGIHIWAIRIPSIILSTISIKLIYDIANRLYNNETAFLSAFLFSINGLIIELSSGRIATDHVDVDFLFFIMLAIWSAVKNTGVKYLKFTILTGASLGCAILCKWLPALIVLPIFLLVFYDKGTDTKGILRHFILLLLVAATVVLPWQIYIMHQFPYESHYEYLYNLRHISEPLIDSGNNFFFHFQFLRINFGELVYLPVIWFSFVALRKLNFYNTALFIWFWIPYLFFSFCATKMVAYTVPAAPAVLIITAKAFFAFKKYAYTFIKFRWLLLLISYGFILLPVRYSLERISPFVKKERNPEWNKRIDEFSLTNLNRPKTILFNCAHPIEMMFKTDCTCYDYIPDSLVIQRLKNENYNVVVFEN
jgi:4-amino-4-deoxy-L-arabinose transferase